jgi:hypothetical protein
MAWIWFPFSGINLFALQLLWSYNSWLILVCSKNDEDEIGKIKQMENVFMIVVVNLVTSHNHHRKIIATLAYIHTLYVCVVAKGNRLMDTSSMIMPTRWERDSFANHPNPHNIYKHAKTQASTAKELNQIVTFLIRSPFAALPIT